MSLQRILNPLICILPEGLSATNVSAYNQQTINFIFASVCFQIPEDDAEEKRTEKDVRFVGQEVYCHGRIQMGGGGRGSGPSPPEKSKKI